MCSLAQQESLLKDSLFQFITKNIPSANVDVIDDIVLTYVSSILEQASQDPCFDLEGFVEMMSAYIPEFEKIDAGAVCTWILELEQEIRRDETDSSCSDVSRTSEKVNLSNLSNMLPAVTPKNGRSHSNSESSADEGDKRNKVIDREEYAEQCQMLHEMFPNTCAMEIKHCVSIAGGNMEKSAATLLHRREQGQALAAAALQPAPRAALCDDSELKSRIIARYSYVDKNSDLKEHKPLAPKNEPKKMVRYRDNKIVSLKGERYTEVPKSGADEEQLKKPKKQHCP